MEELHHGCKPYVLIITKWHSWRDDCSHWRLVNMLGTFWSENISKTVKWLIVLKEETFCCSLRVNTEWSVVWLHPSVLTCSVYSSSLTVLVFCSCSFKRKEDVATPSCLIYIEDVEHLVWWDSGTQLGGVMHSVEPAENLRTWTRCCAEPPKPAWKESLLYCISVEPPDSCVLFMSVQSYLSSVGAVCSQFEDDFCVLQCVWQLHRTCSLTITNMKLSVLCRKVIDTECRSRTEHTATLCGQKAAPHLSVFARKLNDNLLQSSLVFLPMMYVCMYVCMYVLRGIRYDRVLMFTSNWDQ